MHRPRHTKLAAERAHEHRSEMTISEALLWSGIKNKKTGARFRRQVPIGIWIADFASFSPRLVIEVDDESHNWRDETARTKDIKSRGFTILRFDNIEVAQEDVVGSVRHWVECLREGRDPEA